MSFRFDKRGGLDGFEVFFFFKTLESFSSLVLDEFFGDFFKQIDGETPPFLKFLASFVTFLFL